MNKSTHSDQSVTCPLCGQTVPIKSHPSPAWRSMLPHNHNGEQCPGTGRGLAEARELAGSPDLGDANRPQVHVHTDDNPDEVRCFYEVPDALARRIQPQGDRRTFAQCLADLMGTP